MSASDSDKEISLEVEDLSKKFVIGKGKRGVIAFLLYLCVLTMNMVMKTFNVAQKSIKSRLELSDIQYGTYGTVFQFGTFVSTVFLMFVFRNADRKSTILSSLFLSGFLLFFFKFATNPIILLPCQFLIGFCSMTMNIYIIIWCDQFGYFFFKTLFLTLIGLFKALGVVSSLLLNYSLGEENYQTQFLIIGIILITLGVILSFFNRLYFSARIYLYKAKTYDDQKLLWKTKTGKDEPDEEDHGYESIYRYRKSDTSTSEMTPPEIVWGALSNRIYFMGLWAGAVLGIASFGFNFWVIDYYNTVYENVKPWDKLFTLMIILVAGPLGSSIINFIICLIVGGYHHKSTCILMFTNYLIATIAGNLIPHLTNYALIVLCTACFFMGSASVTPFLQGTNFSGGTLSRKPFGILTANLWGTVFGGMPGPILYAFLSKYCGGDKVKTLSYFMKLLWLGVVFDFIMMCFKLSTFKKKTSPPVDKKPIELEKKN